MRCMASGRPRFRVQLCKADFRFSAAHFTVFADGSAELLHGHNYQVAIELEGGVLDDQGLLVDFARIKGAVRLACDRLDGGTLVPERSSEVEVARGDGFVEVAFRRRRYRLPVEDVVLLPLANTSIELLARHLWEELAPLARSLPVERLSVRVEETPGQACVYEADL